MNSIFGFIQNHQNILIINNNNDNNNNHQIFYTRILTQIPVNVSNDDDRGGKLKKNKPNIFFRLKE
ncbi:hypothetical protein DERP_011660 [Dermatophagoides pteronyssinus]|uniref:Uncharacterized protein n=1 Tax=Dermatophagoides pteronyssinus TaxID=6956 RepID=A0ABQ8JWX6_DERPT|nr:hypothetical protein DERP_011660 [Dermatophagoides pteronyssinus]